MARAMLLPTWGSSSSPSSPLTEQLVDWLAQQPDG